MKYLKIEKRLRGLKSNDVIWLLSDGMHCWVNNEMRKFEMKNGVLKIY